MVTAIGWTMVLAVVSQLWPVELVWLPIGFSIGAVGISLFLLAASKEHPRGTPRTVAIIVLVALGGLLAYSLLGPFGIPEQPTRPQMVESLGYLAAVPAFIALQIGLASVARNHPATTYRSISRSVAVIYTVLFVITVSVLIWVLDAFFSDA